MIFELERMKSRLMRLSSRKRSEITDEFLDILPKDTKLYQAYFMGKEEQTTKEVVTADLIGVARAMDDTERTYLLKISRRLLREDSHA